jgi:hypothetical protein
LPGLQIAWTDGAARCLDGHTGPLGITCARVALGFSPSLSLRWTSPLTRPASCRLRASPLRLASSLRNLTRSLHVGPCLHPPQDRVATRFAEVSEGALR